MSRVHFRYKQIAAGKITDFNASFNLQRESQVTLLFTPPCFQHVYSPVKDYVCCRDNVKHKPTPGTFLP